MLIIVNILNIYNIYISGHFLFSNTWLTTNADPDQLKQNDLNSHSVKIDLKNIYINYILDVWIFPDMRYVGHGKMNTASTMFNMYSTYLYETTNMESGKYGMIFKTDAYTFRLDSPQNYAGWGNGSNPTIEASSTNTGCLASIKTLKNEGMTYGQWSRLIFESRYNTVTSTTTYSISMLNRFYHSYNGYSTVNAESQPISSGAGSCNFSAIYFCVRDANMGCNPGYWMSSFYKDLKIWDAKYTNAAGIVNNEI